MHEEARDMKCGEAQIPRGGVHLRHAACSEEFVGLVPEFTVCLPKRRLVGLMLKAGQSWAYLADRGWLELLVIQRGVL